MSARAAAADGKKASAPDLPPGSRELPPAAMAAYLVALWWAPGLDASELVLLSGAGVVTLAAILRLKLPPGQPAALAMAGNAFFACGMVGAGWWSAATLGGVWLVSSVVLQSWRWMAAVTLMTMAGWWWALRVEPRAADTLLTGACAGLTATAVLLYVTRALTERKLKGNIRALEARVAELQVERDAQERSRQDLGREAARVLETRGETEGLWDWDLQHDKVNFSPRWSGMLGYSPDEIGDSPDSWFNLIHPHDLGRTLDRMTAHLEGREPGFECEHRIRLRDGGYCWVLSRGRALLGADGKPERLLGAQIHLGRLKSFESKLLHDATHDRLTGLPNRQFLLARLREDVARAGRNERYCFAVVFIDLDGFKGVNDSLGHLAGDRLLGMVGKRLAETKRPEDTMARLGGDEFVMILRNLRDENEALSLATGIQTALAEPFRLAGQEILTGASIGLAMHSAEVRRGEDLLRNADIAMYHAKSARTGEIQLFDRAMHVRTRRMWNLQSDLRRAIDRQELRLLYQPFVELDRGRICGAEALIRWRRSDGEMISPMEFIPLAEEQGLIGAIGEWALRTACAQNKTWQESGLRPIKVSVNLSAKQLSNHEFAETVRRVIEETGLEPRWLQLELTESALMGSLDATPASLYSLFCMDIQLAIDDFGTGYSSLEYLRKLQFDTLKIDKSFVEDIVIDRRAAALAQSIISMAHSLRMTSLAEGVETPQQLELLRAYGCGVVQGYLASRPVSAEELEALLAADVRLLDGAAPDRGRRRSEEVPDQDLVRRFAELNRVPLDPFDI
jgi:diguanylate cyclase (GGDEF)-like protein/PAS domain S-box-containing protein